MAWQHCLKLYDRVGREKLVIGSAGRAPGKFIYPTGCAFDEDEDTLYVVDSGNHRIQRLTMSGEPLAEWGSAGTGDGQFVNPHGIVFACGVVIVSDAGAHRLCVLDKELRFVRHLGSGRQGKGDSDLHKPQGLAVWHPPPSRSGQQPQERGGGGGSPPLLFVADSENHRVQVLSLPSGQYVRTIGLGEGAAPGQMQLPGGVAVDGLNRRLLVSECRGRRLQVFTLEGEPLQVVSSLAPMGIGKKHPVVFQSVCCAASADESKAYVADFANHRVAVLRLTTTVGA